MAREYLLIAPEETPGVPASGDPTPIRLSSANAFNFSPQNVIGEIPTGGGVNTIACTYSAQKQLSGTLQTELYPSQAGLLLGWATQPIDAGSDLPWATGSGYVSDDLASCTIYHAYETDEGTWKCEKFSGVKVAGGSLSSQSAQPWNLSLNLQGTGYATMAEGDFPFPDESDYPCGPFVWPDLKTLKIATDRSDMASVNFTWSNTLAVGYFEGMYPRKVKFVGRGNGTTLTVNLLLKGTPDDEAAYLNLTKHDTELVIEQGSNQVKIDLNTNNWFSARNRDLAIDGYFMREMVIRNGLDSTAGSDFVVTVTTA